MALDQTANFIRGSVSAAVGSGDGTVSVTDASLYPDPSNGEYNLVIWDGARPDLDDNVEILRVTARDTGTDELTVDRGQEGTSAAEHSDAAELQLSPTAKLVSDIENRYVAEGENFDGQGTSEFSNLSSVDTKVLGSDRYYAGAFDGSDPDARLDATLSQVSGGERIYLEGGTYSADRSISQSVHLEGVRRDQTVIDGDWTLEGSVSSLMDTLNNGTLAVNGFSVIVERVYHGNGSITVGEDNALLSAIRGSSVTFESGTSEGVIDTSAAVNVTDNGSNTVGDIS